MMMFSRKLKLVTHDGAFHADDVFAAALLSLYLKEKGRRFEIVRTRDEDYIKTADYVFDVGGIYNDEKNLFDHHQLGGAGKRGNGIEYSSFGLIWKKIGAELCGAEKIAEMINKKLVAPIDANDNGFDLVTSNHEVSPYTIQDLFYSMRATWREEDLTDDEVFFQCVEIAKKVLTREIVQAKDGAIAAERVTLIYNSTSDKRIIVFDKNYAFQYDVENFPEPLFTVYPSRSVKNKWTAKAVREDPKAFRNRKDFPKSWAGLRNEELQKVSGVPDAVFCHRNLFLVVAKSKEGAIKLAQIAIDS